MPAYFSVSFIMRKDNIADDTVALFYRALNDCGAVFKSGFYISEGESLERITEWNSRKLMENFQIGYDEHFSNDYRQVLFDYFGFSEVRVFILNEKQENTFTFELIIPEDDLTVYDESSGHWTIIKDRMLGVKELIVKMWAICDLDTIQTTWEGSDLPASLESIRSGKTPSAEPYAVIPKDAVKDEWGYLCEDIQNGGVLLIARNEQDEWHIV